jgi:hypothetical protein
MALRMMEAAASGAAAPNSRRREIMCVSSNIASMRAGWQARIVAQEGQAWLAVMAALPQHRR